MLDRRYAAIDKDFMYLFYTPDIDTSNFLSEEESGHCVRVLRYDRGDEILLTDGRGSTYHARITNPHPRHCEFEVISQEIQEKTHNIYLHVAIAPTKNIERLEWMVEKCTEIGVDEITPLLCRFSERKNLRNDRLEKIILSAAKQSLTPYLPKLNPLTDFATLMQMYGKEAKGEGQKDMDKFIAHCYKDEKRELRDALRKGRDVLILIGPEGDFSEQEVEHAIKEGFLPVGLGRSRLRTETAGVVACHTAVLLNED
jgi:16S rRNA (uracil1498-N3)-methyltransferase